MQVGYHASHALLQYIRMQLILHVEGLRKRLGSPSKATQVPTSLLGFIHHMVSASAALSSVIWCMPCLAP